MDFACRSARVLGSRRSNSKLETLNLSGCHDADTMPGAFASSSMGESSDQSRESIKR